MRKLFLNFALLVISSSAAKAEIIDNPKDICKAAQSRSGAWMDTSSLKKCLENTELLGSYKLELQNMEEQEKSYIRTVELLNEQIDGNNKNMIAIGLYNEDLKKYNDKMEEDMKKWFHNPWIMASIGILAGALTTTAIVAVAKD